MRFAALLCAGLLAALWLTTPARAQLESREAISLQDQILELRHELQQRGMNEQSGGGEPVAPPIGAPPIGAPPATEPQPGSGLTPQLLERVTTLEDEVRSLRGQVDQLTNQVQQQNAALAKQIGDLSFAAQQGHPAAASEPAPATTPVPQSAGRLSSDELVRRGQASLGRRDFAAAETDAHQALAASAGAHQADARYLLAQSLAGQRHYQQAATAYYDVYSHSPNSSRAPEALLGVGASLLALHDKSDACEALRKLAVSYPHPAAHVRTAAATLRGRAGCR